MSGDRSESGVVREQWRTRPSGRAGAGGAQGYTMLELVVVLTLLALLMSLVLPGLQRSIKKQRDLAHLRQLTTVLRLARSQASTTRQRVRLFLNTETGAYRLEGTTRQGVLTGMRLSDTWLVWQDTGHHRGYIAFYGDGSSSGGQLILEDLSGRRYRLEVEMITGKVNLKMKEQTG